MMLFKCISGESNVYTIGKMGNHRVVCTKLPALGLSREATTAAGNAITRLLGRLFLFTINKTCF